MKRDEMTKLVNEELFHIPKGDDHQKLLRYCYNMVRRNHLSISEHTPKEETLAYCIKLIGKDKTGWHPNYDKNFFNMNLITA